MLATFRGEEFRINNYLDGNCPGCRTWEAPITESHLALASDRPVYHMGSGPRTNDENVPYHRETWREFFKCPVCQVYFCVPYSST